MRKAGSPINLTLFFSRGMSLRKWAEVGMFDREVALYLRLQELGMKIAFVTYGDKSDLQYSQRIPGITILFNKWRLPMPLYEYLIPKLHKTWLRQTDIVKTNQTNGAQAALRAAQKWGKLFVSRCGFMWSEFADRISGENSKPHRQALDTESKVFKAADHIIVTTAMMKDDVIQRFPEAAARISIVPNYVDTDLFKPSEDKKIDSDIIFVGRLERQKNVESLLEAVEKLDVKLKIIGSGSEKAGLQNRFSGLGGRVQWIDKVMNSELQSHFNDSGIFILPSHFEGHPKTLIEAMACGLPVIGASSPGIRELIRHGETGLLCGTDPKSIGKSIETLISNKDLRERLGRAARKYAEDNFSLDKIVSLELAVYEQLMASRS